jgi:hypothetical protein
MTFSTELERRSDAAVVAMTGDLDIATEAQATAQLERAMDGGCSRSRGWATASRSSTIPPS